MQIVPIFTKESKQCFCQYTSAKEHTAVVDGQSFQFQTNWLRPNIDVNLLGVSQSDVMLHAGVVDSTDSISSNGHPAITELMIRVNFGGKHHLVPVTMGPEALFEGEGKGTYRRMTVRATKSLVLAVDGFQVATTISLMGQMNLELGEINLAAAIQAPDVEHIEIVGYKVKAFRSNANRQEYMA